MMGFKPLLLVLFHFQFFITSPVISGNQFVPCLCDQYQNLRLEIFLRHILFISFLNLCQKRFLSERSFQSILFASHLVKLDYMLFINTRVCGCLQPCAFQIKYHNQKNQKTNMSNTAASNDFECRMTEKFQRVCLPLQFGNFDCCYILFY